MNSNQKVSDRVKEQIYQSFYKGTLSRKEISQRFNVNIFTVKDIVRAHMSPSGHFVKRPQSTIPNLENKTLPGEKWRKLPLPSKSRYEVSSLGRIRSYAYDKNNGDILRGGMLFGYLKFEYVNSETKKRISVLVHKLVADTFLTPPKDIKKKKYFLVHKNHKICDNRASNLSYVPEAVWRKRFSESPFVKLQYKRHGVMLKKKVDKNKFTYFAMTSDKVLQLKKELFNKTITVNQAQEKYKITAMQIARIARGDSWPDIAPQFTRKKNKIATIPVRTRNLILAHLKRKNMYQVQIANKFGVSTTLVSRLKKANLK